MDLVLIPGLGNDHRVFRRLQLDGHKIKAIDLIDPQNSTDSLDDYVDQLIDKYKICKNDFLIGFSFGGILAQEIAHKLHQNNVIIISSLKSQEEIPQRFRIYAKNKVYNLFKFEWVNFFRKFAFQFTGNLPAEDWELFNKMLIQTNPKFYEWVICQILDWQPKNFNFPIFHIHGEKDQVFPIQYISHSIPIKNGNHLMILSDLERVEKVILEILEENKK